MSTLTVNRRVPYVRLGNSGLKVSKLILGCMSYGTPVWRPWVLPYEKAVEHIKFAYENGIQTFDTANIYSNGESEIVLGKAIKELQLPREEIVVMTKLYGTVSHAPSEVIWTTEEAESKGYVNQQGHGRKHIFDSVRASLQRLQLDYVDLLQLHRFDYDAPIEETMQALHDVVKAGYVRYIGMSSCWAHQFHVMQNYAISHNLTPFVSMQNHYNILYREEEREMMPTLKHFGVGSIPWSPLARGAACRPVAENEKSVRDTTDFVTSKVYTGPNTQSPAIMKRVEELAEKHGVSMAQISLAWVMAKPGITAPIIGSTDMEKLKENIAALEVKLSAEDVKYLDEPYVPVATFGHY